jgi:hypothetical protein
MNFDIPQFYRETNEGTRYLLADRVQRANEAIVKRIIVFSTDEQLRLLFTCSHIMMDGTFDPCPQHFDQVYSIHGIKNDQSRVLWLFVSVSTNFFQPGFVCVLALLCGRSTVIYKELFSILTHHACRLKLKFRPAQITSDFESALIKAVAEEVGSLFVSL